MKLSMYGILAAVLLFTAFATQAQGASCICTNGCIITADPYPTGPDQPTYCVVRIAGVQAGIGNVVASSSIPLLNTARCLPANSAYVAGPVSNVSCFVSIPAQPLGNTTVAMAAGNSVNESTTTLYTFINVTSLPIAIKPVSPNNLRIADGTETLNQIVADGFTLSQLVVGLRYYDLDTHRG